MCMYFKFHYTSRFNRRRRKWFAALSFTSGLTMFLLINQRRILRPMDLETVESIPQPTNETLTDFFLGDAEKNTEYSYYMDRSIVGISTEPTTTSYPNIFNPRNKDEDSTRAPLCCTEDFHQSPYHPEDKKQTSKKKTSRKKRRKSYDGKYLSLSSSLRYNNVSTLGKPSKRGEPSFPKINKHLSNAKLRSESKSDLVIGAREENKKPLTSNTEESSQTHHRFIKEKGEREFPKYIKTGMSQYRKHHLTVADRRIQLPKNVTKVGNLHSRKAKIFKAVNSAPNNIKFAASLTSSQESNFHHPYNGTPIYGGQLTGNAFQGDGIDKKGEGNKLNTELRRVPIKSKTNSISQAGNPSSAVPLISPALPLIGYNVSKNNSSFTNKKNATSDDKNTTNSNSTILQNETNTSLIIPEASITTNMSFVTVKNRILNKLLDRIDLAKMFSNSSYKTIILSRNLSQWNEFLGAPDDSPRHTFEPAFVEVYDWRRTSKPTNLINDDLEVRNGPQGAGQNHGKSRSHNGNARRSQRSEKFPLSLREIPRFTIRKPYEITTAASAHKRHNDLKRSSEGRNKTATTDIPQTNLPMPNIPNVASSSDVVYPFHLDYSRPAYFPWHSTPDECSNFATRFLVAGSGKVVPLVSFPGSGNSWLRYLVEATTGVFTGTLYEDDVLALKGFWGERDSYLDGTTLLQKTHSLPVLPEEATRWEGKMILGSSPRKIVLLIRSPYEALVSLRHFHAAGHTGFGHHVAFSGKGWDNFTEERASSWLRLNTAWLQLPDSKVLVVHYEILMQNLDTEIQRILKFLGIPIDYGRLSCLLRYPEGKLRRPRYPKHLQGYQISYKTATILGAAIASLDELLSKQGHPSLPTQLYGFIPATRPP